MVIGDILKKGIELLKGNSFANPSLEARLILSRLLDVDKSFLYAHTDFKVESSVEKRFIEICKKRQEGYPLQYLIGVQEFYGREFKVTEGVLIPRGDTEILIEKALKLLKEKSEPEVLDIGVGCGNIAITIALENKASKVYGVDINEKAISLTKENIKRLNAQNVNVVEGSLLEPFGNKRFDLIVSNPPYIPHSDKASLQIEVNKYEPSDALFADLEGLWFYDKISKKAKANLKKNGLLAFEIGYNQGNEVMGILKKNGYIDIELEKDLEDRDRVVTGKLM